MVLIADIARFVRRVISVVVGVITVAFWRRELLTCDDPGTATCGNNPRLCGTSEAMVFGPAGLADYSACGPGPHTLVRSQAGFTGLDSATRAELRFAPAAVVTVKVVHFSQPARIEALGAGAAQIRMMAPTAHVLQEFRFTGTAIDRIVVTPASATDITLIIGWCH